MLAYGQFADATTEQVIDVLTDLETTSNQLTDYTVDSAQSVAVVGERQFTPLERSILPESYDSYSLFVDESFEQPPFNIFDSSSAIIDALVATVDEETAREVAVVLDSGSRYSSIVESAGIPYYGGLGFIDDSNHRAVLRLLRYAHRGTGTTVGDVIICITDFTIALPRLSACQEIPRHAAGQALAVCRESSRSDPLSSSSETACPSGFDGRR